MIKCIAVDDEALALDLLADNIRRIPYLELVATCNNAREASQALADHKVDLIFLDIQMPGINGINFLKGIQHPPMAIILSAYPDFALEGYELSWVDYLVKPVSFNRFEKAVLKAKDLFELRNPTTDSDIVDTSVSEDYFFVNADQKLIRVRYDEIYLVEGLKDYIKIHLSGQARPLVTRMSMKNMESRLEGKGFLRIHKSFIVSLDKIKAVKKGFVLVNDREVPYSDNQKALLFEYIDKMR